MPNGKPSLKALCVQDRETARIRTTGLIDLFRDKSHICTEGYMLYGWQF